MRELIILCLRVPDRQLALRALAHQGTLSKNSNNFEGALHSFVKMRDIAEDLGDRVHELEAYSNMGHVL